MDNSKDELSKEFKLEKLGLNLTNLNSQISDDILNELYKTFIEKNKNIKKYHIKQPKCDKIDKEDEKYKITLKFLNAILKILDKEQIKDIIQFQNINRKDLLKKECLNILDNFLEEIIKYFGKTKIRYKNKNDSNSYILTLIKFMVAYCGYRFQSYIKFKNINVSPKKYIHENITLYSICE